LSTEIGVGTRDSHGKKLDPFMRMTIDRMKKWQKRIKTLSSEERWLSNILPNILESSYALSLPQIVSETAAHLCRISWKQRVIQNKSSLGMTAAFVYLACRKCGVGRSLKEVAKAVGIEKRTAAKHYRYLLREVEKEYMPAASVEKYISKLANIAKIDPRTERLALWIAGRTRDVDISSGKLPAGLAAAYVYIASVLNGERIAQREIAEYAEVTEVTVRSRCKEMFDSFIICQRLHAMNGERKTE
jgi:transcription initiation factor TFIIB